jgi:hypothetical protein
MAIRLDAATRATDRSASSIVRLALRAVLPDDQETRTTNEDHYGLVHPAIRGAALHQRQMEIERERAEAQREQQDRVRESNEQYLRQLDAE